MMCRSFRLRGNRRGPRSTAIRHNRSTNSSTEITSILQSTSLGIPADRESFGFAAGTCIILVPDDSVRSLAKQRAEDRHPAHIRPRDYVDVHQAKPDTLDSRMPIVIDETVEVDAPHDFVWDVITDFRRYGEWNPFVVACDSTLKVGDPIEMRVHLFGAFAQPQREIIFEHEPGKRFCYGVAGVPFGAMRSNRCHEVRVLDSGRSEYRSHFELSGWLSPVVSGLLGSQLRRGFHAMTESIRTRSEQLASRSRSGFRRDEP